MSSGIAVDVSIENPPIGGTNGLIHVPTPTGTFSGSVGGSGGRIDEASVSEKVSVFASWVPSLTTTSSQVSHRYRCSDAGHRPYQ